MTHAPKTATLPEDSTTTVEGAAPSASTETKPNLMMLVKGSSFPLILTVLAIFPIALGIGSIRLKAAATSTSSTIAANDSEEEEHEEEAPPTPRPLDRRVGDEHFLERRYEVALHYYQSLGSVDHTRLPAELRYRVGLCQEGLGLWDEALENLNGVSAATDNPVLKAAADFGQARLFLRLNSPGKAASILRSIELRRRTDCVLPGNMSQEIAFLIPIALAHEATSRESLTTSGKPDQIGDLFIWSLESALAWGNQPQQNEESVGDAVAPANANSFHLNRSKEKTTKPQSIEGMEINACSKEQPLRLIVESLARECGWNVDWTNLANDKSLDQISNYVTENRPVSLMLTVLCSELQSTWSLNDNRLTICREIENGIQSRQMIGRTLQNLMVWNPNHRFTNHCRFSLAQFAEIDGDLPKAALLYSSMVGRGSSPLAIRAAYTAGTIYFRIGDLSRASFQLDFVVNAAPGHELHTESLILLGRVLLELGETQEAVFQFRRATEARKHPQDQARAAAFLGMALLIQEKYHEAAEAILAHRFQFDEPGIRSAGSLVTALARWKSLSGEKQESEAAFLYRALVAVKTESEPFGKMFGQTGQLLIGRAYSELGLDDQMAELYLRMQSTGVTETVDLELTYSLANYESLKGHTDTARAMWSTITNRESNRWTNRARMRLAEMALNESQPSECLKHCESIQVGEGINRLEVKKLMGKAFEQLGDDVRAARCYAGQSPNP